MTERRTYVSGIRPGRIHLGNYLGALRQWREVKFTDHGHHFFVADLHDNRPGWEADETVYQLQNLGIHARKQSEYAGPLLRLAHDLSFHAPCGWLNRMTQFKDKSETEAPTLALFSYPVLMAADILFNRATHVPVGADQAQHVEFVRDLVGSLHARGLNPEFLKPTVEIGNYPRIMSLKDASKKMSKSDPDDDSRINMDDSADAVRRKVRAAKTSMGVCDNTAEARNLRAIYLACGGARADHARWPEFKAELTDLLVAELKAR